MVGNKMHPKTGSSRLLIGVLTLLYLIATLLPASATSATVKAEAVADVPCDLIVPAASAAAASAPSGPQQVKLTKEQVALAAFEASYKHRYKDAEELMNTFTSYMVLATRDPNLPWSKIFTEFNNKFVKAIPPQDMVDQNLHTFDDILHTAFDVMLTIPEVRHAAPLIWQRLSETNNPDSVDFSYFGDSASKVASSAWRYSKAARLMAETSQIIAAARECAKHDPEFAKAFDGRHVGLRASILDDPQTILENNPEAPFPTELRGKIAADGTITISLEELKALGLQELEKVNTTIDEIQETLLEIDKNQDIIVDYIQDQQTKELKEKLAAKKAAEFKLKLDATKAAVSIFVTLMGQSDPKFAKQFNTVATSSIQVGEALKGWLEATAGLNALDKAFSLSTVVMTGNMLGAVMNVVALFAPDKPTPEQQILEEIGKLRQQVDQLRTEMHSRFDRIDQGLNAIYTTMHERFDQIDIQLGKLNGKVSDVQMSLISLDLKLSNMERNNFELMNSDARIELVEAINGGLGYLERVGEPMPYLTHFEPFENKLHSWATVNAFLPINTGPTQRDISDTAIFEELNKYPLDLNVNYLNSWLVAHGLPAITDIFIASPRDWLFASRAYTQLGLEWPEHMVRISPNRQTRLDEVGADIEAAMRNISTVDTASGPQGNTLLFSSVITYYEDKVQTLESLLADVEENYLREVRDGRLKRTEPFDLYGGIDQQLSYITPELSAATCGNAEAYGSFPPPSNLGSFIPNYARLMLADYLKLGTLKVCLHYEQVNPQDVCYTEPDPPYAERCDTYYSAQAVATVYFDNVSVVSLTSQQVGGYLSPDWFYHYGQLNPHWTEGDNFKAKLEAVTTPDMPSPEVAAQRAELLNAVNNKLELVLSSYQHELYARILDELTIGSLKGAAASAAGGKTLLGAFTALGLPRAVAEDEFLHAMLYGNQQLVDTSQIIQSYTLSYTQPITGTGLLVNPRLVIGEAAEKRLSAFRELLFEYLDAITAGTHSEFASHIADTRRVLDLTMRMIDLMAAEPAEPPVTPTAPVTPEPPVTPGTPTTPEPGVTPMPPLPANAKHNYLPSVER